MDIKDIIESKSRVIGYRQVMRGIGDGTVTAVALAKDADPHITESIERAAKESKVTLIKVASCAYLGAMCSIEVKCAVAGCNKSSNQANN